MLDTSCIFLISRSLTDDTFLYRYYWALRLAIGPVYYQQLQRLVIALNNKKQQTTQHTTQPTTPAKITTVTTKTTRTTRKTTLP